MPVAMEESPAGLIASGFVSDRLMEMLLSVAFPELVIVTVFAVLLVPVVWFPKEREDGLSVTTGVGGTMPVPLRAIKDGEPEASVAMETDAE
jgi:hypothetical protein